MATVSTPAASIAIPNDVSAFAATVSPRGVDLDQRLDQSLDALIKERRKEHKQLKKEEVKKLKHQAQGDKRKPVQQQRKQKQKQKQQARDVKSGQKAQRKALVNKNRGLPTLPAPKGKTLQVKTKTSIAATTAKLRRQMRAGKMAQSSQRLVVSPKAAKGVNQNTAGQQSKKKNHQQQPRKTVAPARVVQQNRAKQQSQPLKQHAKASSKTPLRQVTRITNKKARLSITIAGSGAKVSKKAQKKQRKAANKVLLPGKVSQALTKQPTTAKTTVKRSKSRKLAESNAKHVVRRVGQRKKN